MPAAVEKSISPGSPLASQGAPFTSQTFLRNPLMRAYRALIARRKGQIEISCTPRLRKREAVVALGQPGAHSRRAVQRRAPRGACAKSRARADRVVQDDQGSAAGAAARRQWRRSARGLSRDRQGDQRGSRHNAGGGMARRQLSSRREANSRASLGPAARLLPPASQARLGSLRRLSPRLRRGLGLRRPHRQPLRLRDAGSLRQGLSGGAAAHHRRTLGGVDHAADRAGRKSRTPRAADHAKPRGAHRGGRPRRPFARDRGTTRRVRRRRPFRP